jgi:hypothetical protein
MRDVIYVIAVIAFFGLGAAYIAACARILAGDDDVDEIDDVTESADAKKTPA